ncbi:MAG: anthranilate phosphoribosyltransferase [Paludibacteraceae bacterium]|nr:anthranilate phosphoribosyltransferase [Paludibacteraceae bacterium]
MKEILSKLYTQYTMTQEEARNVMLGIAEGRYCNEQIAACLAIMQTRGISVDELLGVRQGMLETGVPVDLGGVRVVDIVGTGGDGKNTFNISTCACFVLAGAGFKVAKHGNYAATSVSGASNVLEGHGVKFTNDSSELRRSLDGSNFCYMHAPLFAKGMKNVVPVRKALQVPTLFNLLGPTINPCRPQCQCLGTANLEQMRLYANVFQKLKMDYAIVTSEDGYDEISLTSDFKITAAGLEKVYSPADFGLPTIRPEEIYGGSTKEEAKQIFDNVLTNSATESQKNVVLINAAAAMRVYNSSLSMEECLALAKESVESGKAKKALENYIRLNS